MVISGEVNGWFGVVLVGVSVCELSGDWTVVVLKSKLYLILEVLAAGTDKYGCVMKVVKNCLF
jgi:hypothetical protein